MPNLNKLLNKVNQASQAIKSAKGIKSKIESIGYKGGIDTSVVDQLQEIAEENRKLLEERRTSLQKQISNVNTGKSVAKKTPMTTTVDLQYPKMVVWIITLYLELDREKIGINLIIFLIKSIVLHYTFLKM